MKVLKLALIGTAALAAASVTARADDLADLKAQIEALNGRISQLEAAPAVPAGYQLLSVSKADAIVVPSLDVDGAYKQTNVTTIGILPTADVPASTNIQWSGYARAGLIYSHTSGVYPSGKKSGVDIAARGQLKVVGTTDTSVGEVGAQIQIRGNYHGHGDAGTSFYSGYNSFKMNEAWGWWKMTPELTLGGGYTGSLSAIGYGIDGSCNCYYTDNASSSFYNHGDTTQMRLSYASGPMSAAIALEDDHGHASHFYSESSLGVAGEVKYSGDMLSGEVSAGVWNKGTGVGATSHAAWQIAAGMGFNLGDMAKLSIAAGTGRSHSNTKYWSANALLSANLSDAVHAEIGYGHGHNMGARTEDTALAGIYYDPVSQLTVGLEGEWIHDKNPGSKVSNTTVDLVTVFRF